MKRTIYLRPQAISLYLSLLLLMCMHGLAHAQIQNNIWTMPPYLASNSLNTFSSLPIGPHIDDYQGQDAVFSHNAYHNADGNLIFFVVDNYVYDHEGYIMGDMGVYGTSETMIVPDPFNCERYYIFVASGAGYQNVYEQAPFMSILDLGEVSNYYPGRYGTLEQFQNTSSLSIGTSTITPDPSFFTGDSKQGGCYFASSRLRSNGTRLVFISNGHGIFRYVIDGTGPTGFHYDNAHISYGPSAATQLQMRGEMELIQLNNGNYRIAVPYVYEYVSGQWGGGIDAKYAVFTAELDPVGDLVFGTTAVLKFNVYNPLGQSRPAIHGLEFSPDGSKLWITHNPSYYHPSPINFYDFDNTSPGVQPMNSFDPERFQYSQLEIGPDERLYMAIDDRFGVFDNPNDPYSTSFFEEPYPAGITYAPNSYDFGPVQYNLNSYILPDQIDGENYYIRGDDNVDLCCFKFQGFTASSHTVSGAMSQLWEPGSATNPFGTLPTVKIENEILISSGFHVHMKDISFQFGPEGKIIVEPGARLTLTHTRLTSMDCDETMWKGVELRGNPSIDQTPYSNQGYLVMQSSSEISNAINGVSVYGRFSNGNTNWNQTGGLIHASNSTFRNNRRDVEYLTYGFENLGAFFNCTFLTDDALKNGSVPISHVSMFQVGNLKFAGCDFKNTTSGIYADNQRGDGIRTFDAEFTVGFKCNSSVPAGDPCPNKDRSLFEGLYYGIYAESTNPIYTATIGYSDFVDNSRSIYFAGVDYAKVVENNFTVLPHAPYTYGLYLDQCSGYLVENNHLSSTASTNSSGMIIANSNDGGTSAEVNEIYNNSFEGFDNGTVSFLQNVQLEEGNPVTNTGLTFKCNSYEASTSYDIINTLGGVSPFQGDCSPTSPGEPHAPANNVFSSTPSSFGDFWNDNTNVYQVSYSFSSSSSFQTEPRPGYYNPINTGTSECVNLSDFDPEESCPVRDFDAKKKGRSEKQGLASTDMFTPDADLSDYEKVQMMLAKNEVIRNYMHDPNLPLAQEDLIEFLKGSSNSDDQRLLCALYVGRGQQAQALSMMKKLSEKDKGLHLDFCQYQKAWLAFNTDNAAKHSTDEHLNTFRSIANLNNESQEAFSANRLFHYLDGTRIEEYIPTVREGAEKTVEVAPESNLSFYPNPTKDLLNINWNEVDEVATLVIFDLSGKTCLKLAVDPSQKQVDISSLNSGLYLVKAQWASGKTQYHKLRIN